MILKSMSRTGGFLKAFLYVDQESKTKGEPLLWNLRTNSHDIQDIAKEFLNNSNYSKERKGGVKLYHEVISLSDKDQGKVNSEILIDLCTKYLETRASNALAFVVPHFDTRNPHAHILISGNQRKNSRQNRMTKGEFNTLKQELEKYQQVKYPELEYSKVNHTPDQKEKEKRIQKTIKEQERDRRQQKQGVTELSKKEQLREILLKILDSSYSLEEFLKKLKETNINLYKRGKNISVHHQEDQKKYRLKTLGIQDLYEERLSQWERAKIRTKEIEEIKAEKGQKLWREMGFTDDIDQVLNKPDKPDQRQKELDEIKRQKRKHQRDQSKEIFL